MKDIDNNIDNVYDFITKYPLGTIVLQKCNNLPRVDEIAEYIMTKNGTFVVLELDTYIHPRLSTRMTLDFFCKEWKVVETKKEKEPKKSLNH